MILNKVFIKIICIFLFIFVLSVILLLFLNKEIHKPLEVFDDDIVLEVKKGANSEQIFQLLKKYNLVHSRLKYTRYLYFIRLWTILYFFNS